MSHTTAKPKRSWQDIVAEAARASRENKLVRLADLRLELESVLAILDHRNKGVRAEPTSDKLPTQRKTA
jgi:hypothetical protein